MSMQTLKLATAALVLAGLLTGGCGSNATNKPKEPTQKEAALRQWNGTRAAVLYTLAKQQYEGGNFDDCRKSLDDALSYNGENPKLHLLSAKLGIEQGRLEA